MNQALAGICVASSVLDVFLTPMWRLLSKALGNSMNSAIDDISEDYQDWSLDNLSYKDGLLTLNLVTYINGDDPIRFMVVFTDTVLFESYDESSHFQDYHLNRDKGVIGIYTASSLLEYAKTKTNVICLNNDKLSHYSVMTTNEIIHVLTRTEPVVVNVT